MSLKETVGIVLVVVGVVETFIKGSYWVGLALAIGFCLLLWK